MSSGTDLSVIVAFSAGIFSFLSPCVLPLFPSYLSFITGMSLEELQSERPRRALVAGHSLAFILGFSVVFMGMGAVASGVGSLLFDYRDMIRVLGGVLIIAFGLYIARLLPLGFLGRYAQLQLSSKPAGFVGSWLVGVTFAIGWTPCVGPILGGILTLAATPDSLGAGVGLLGAYSAGLGLPFFLSSLALGGFLVAFRRFRPWIPVVERTAGLLLVGVGLLLVTNNFVVLNSYAIGLTPEWLLKRL